MDTSDRVDSLQEGNVEVGSVVLRSLFFHVESLRGVVGYLLVDFDGIDSVELLDLTLCFVQVHNDGLVVGLAEATDELVVLRHHDTINRRHCIGHVVEELTPEPITVGANSVNVSVKVFGRSEITRIRLTGNEDVIVAWIYAHAVHIFLLEATREDGELLVCAGLVLQALNRHG